MLFQVVTVIAKGAIEDVMWAKAAAFENAVDVAVPDGDLVGTGDERPVFCIMAME